jgi:capsular polysaccharide biosynthesis protein
MLGVPAGAVVEVHDDIVVVGDLITSSPLSSEHTRHPSRLAVDLFASLRGAAADVPVPRGMSPRLYLRRTTKRFLTDAEGFEAFLKTRGFSIIEPETFTIAEQAAIFGQARVIVSVFGASLLNIGFAEPGCRVMEIRPETSNDPWTMHLCARMGHFYVSQVAEVRGEEVVWERLGTRDYDREYPMHLPLATLRAAVEAMLGR